MSCVNLVVALSAFAVALTTAIIQIKVHLQELRPYLSFSGTSGKVIINSETGQVGMDFILNLKNVGKCVLYYDVIQFDVFVNGAKMPDVDVKSKGSVIGVNTEAIYRKYYSEVSQHNTQQPFEQYIPPNHKIVFTIEYYKANRPKKRYKLFYEVFVEHKDGIPRELYGENTISE